MTKLSARRHVPENFPAETIPLLTYTPTITAGSGSFSDVSGSIRYSRLGIGCRWVAIKFKVVITDNGTAATSILVSLPLQSSSTDNSVLAGRNSDNDAVYGLITPGASSNILLRLYNGTYPGGDGVTIDGSGIYEIASI